MEFEKLISELNDIVDTFQTKEECEYSLALVENFLERLNQNN